MSNFNAEYFTKEHRDKNVVERIDLAYKLGKIERNNELIQLIEEHQKECDALGIVATAQWVKDLLEAME